jgi:hypothetical protein
MKTEITKSRPKISHLASTAAYDEVFARLSARTLDPAPFRELAADLDRQHERLQRLLRELDESAPSD